MSGFFSLNFLRLNVKQIAFIVNRCISMEKKCTAFKGVHDPKNVSLQISFYRH